MPDVVKHAWTHRPRSQGGTDPLNIPTNLPVAYCENNTGYTLGDGNNYSLTALDGVSETATGIMDSITFANDPGDGSEVFWAGPDNDRVRAFNGFFAVQVEGGVVVDANPQWSGYVTLWVTGGLLEFQTPQTNVVSDQLYDLSDASTPVNSLWQSVRISATVLVNAGVFAQDPIPSNRLDVRVRQSTGGDLTMSQAWSVLTVLTPLEDLVIHTP